MNTVRTRKLVTVSMLSALAYGVMVLLKFPVVMFLSYEPKDVIIAIGGFLYGPMSAMAMSVIVAFVEMVTVSSTAHWGAIMNALSSCTFACTAAFIYKKKQTTSRAAIGLLAGVAVTVPVMLLWNYSVVPLYMGVPRAAVVGMLIPVFLPFNLLKYGLSAAIAMLLFRPIRLALSKSRLLPDSSQHLDAAQKRISTGFILISALIVVTCILVILSWRGII